MMKARFDSLVIAILLLLISLSLSETVINRPASWQAPKNIPASKVPQFIILTHDDAANKETSSLVTSITNKHKNPNNCTINAVFFTTKSGSDCKTIKSLWQNGHEIAEHTLTHPDLTKLSYSQKKTEIVGARDWLVETCNIPMKDVVGHRSPYLVDNADVRKILNDAGFLYDSSIGEIFKSNSLSSPSATQRLFPYSLYNGIKQIQSCQWFMNSNHCTEKERYNGLYEIPLWMPQSGDDEPSSDIMDFEEPYKVLTAEFDRNYAAHKAPIGIWTHSTGGLTKYLTHQENRIGISRFLEYALSKPDVWVVTGRQMIDWMQNPVEASHMKQFMSKYKCQA